MATPTEPVTGALFRALRTTADPELAHDAEEEVRQITSQNVIAVLGAKIDSQGSRRDVQLTEVKAWFPEVNAKIDALGSRIDTLQKVIWPLIVLLATTVFGMLYKSSHCFSRLGEDLPRGRRSPGFHC